VTPRFSLATEEVPQHFEAVSLRVWVQLAGWPLSLTLIAAGVTLAAISTAGPIETAGMLLAAIGGLGVVGLVRCRRFEVVVTSRMLEAGAGPFRRRLPLGFIAGTSVGPAAFWRGLYADREVTVRLHSGGRSVVVPTADPDELLAVLSTHPPG
jgi:hypothetical protein